MIDRLHNNPPDMTVLADEAAQELSNWLQDHPVIELEQDAFAAKKLIDRGKITLRELDSERDGKVRPLNEEVKKINDFYRPAKDLLSRVVEEISVRTSDFLKREERKRIAAALEAVRLAEEAERKAREAERIERDALESAAQGELGVDIKSVVGEADKAFAEFQRADRIAAIAEKDAKVKLGGGILRAMSLRNKEELIVSDPIKAIQVLGATQDITDAILKSARAYRKIYNRLPLGVESKTERAV